MKKTLNLTIFIFCITLIPLTARADNTDLWDQLNEIEDAIHALHLQILEYKGIPRLTSITPPDAEIGEAVVIRGEGFDEPVTILFDSFVAIKDVVPVNSTLLGFRVPEHFLGPTTCTSVESGGRLCTLTLRKTRPEFETYDIRIQHSNGISNSLRLRIEEE